MTIRNIAPTTMMALLLSLIVSTAEAHTGGGGGSFAAGFAHPFSGLDHLLAMTAVGLWAGRIGGHALWLVPAAFVTAMAAGAGVALLGLTVPMVEIGIAASVVLFAALALFGTRLPLAAATAVAALFAVFHGHAHGSELPQAANALTYAAGFLTASVGLHIVGIVAARVTALRLAHGH
jgi:urease accessory protein